MGEGGRLIIDVIIIAIIVIILIIMIIIVLIIICKVGEEVEEGGGRDREWVWTTSSSESTAALSRATNIYSIRKEMYSLMGFGAKSKWTGYPFDCHGYQST